MTSRPLPPLPSRGRGRTRDPTLNTPTPKRSADLAG
jgi:hypothetical protein